MEFDKDLRSRQEVRQLVEQAEQAFCQLRRLSQERLDAITKAISEAGLRHAEELGRMACEETGFGNAKDKAEKNRFAAERVYEAIRDMKTVGILKQEECILIDRDGSITLTEKGLAFATKIFERHTVLSRILMELGVEEKIAVEDACKIEHVISDQSFETLKRHLESRKPK